MSIDLTEDEAKMYRRWLLTNFSIFMCSFFILWELGSIPGIAATVILALVTWTLDAAVSVDGYCRSAWSKIGGMDIEVEASVEEAR